MPPITIAPPTSCSPTRLRAHQCRSPMAKTGAEFEQRARRPRRPATRRVFQSRIAAATPSTPIQSIMPVPRRSAAGPATGCRTVAHTTAQTPARQHARHARRSGRRIRSGRDRRAIAGRGSIPSSSTAGPRSAGSRRRAGPGRPPDGRVPSTTTTPPPTTSARVERNPAGMIEPSMIRDRMVAVIGPHISTIAAVADRVRNPEGVETEEDRHGGAQLQQPTGAQRRGRQHGPRAEHRRDPQHRHAEHIAQPRQQPKVVVLRQRRQHRDHRAPDQRGK